MPEIRLTLRRGKRARSYPAWYEWPNYLVPYRLRSVHRWWAGKAGFFWKPCPLCGQHFAGHEWRSIRGKAASVPDPTEQPTSEYGPRMSVGICPQCTRAGRGHEVAWPDLAEEAT
jgi:hypothetical protein